VVHLVDYIPIGYIVCSVTIIEPSTKPQTGFFKRYLGTIWDAFGELDT
jgi:hypothetical protein